MLSAPAAILTSVYPPQERGKVLGINVATVYTGLSLGPVLGGVMNQHLGWQSIFYLNVLIGCLVVFLAMMKLKGEWAGAGGESFDLGGSALYVSGVTAFMYGISSFAASPWAKYILVGPVPLLLLLHRSG